MAELPFGFELPEDSPGFLLWQTTMIWQRLIRKVLEPYDVSHPQFVIMATLLWFSSQTNEMTQVFLVQWTKLDKMTISNALKKLEQQGLVTRKEHKTDTRAKSISLTKQGKALAHQLVPKVEKVDELFFNALSKQERHALNQSFIKLNHHE